MSGLPIVNLVNVLVITCANDQVSCMKLICWEVKKCGRQPGTEKSNDLGVCPTATNFDVHGIIMELMVASLLAFEDAICMEIAM